MIKLRSPLPLLETEALKEAPIKWEIGSGDTKIQMRTQLFSLAKYELFTQMTSAIMFQTTTGATISLARIYAETQEENKESAERFEEIEDKVKEFHNVYGYTPKDLCQLIVYMSDPVDIPKTIEILNDWGSDNGYQWIIDSKAEWHQIRDSLAEYCKHTCAITEVAQVVHFLQLVNVEVKKKLNPSQEDLKQLFTVAS
jgi:uncharacterized protein YutD